MKKEIHINSHIFSRNLEAKLAENKYLVFNLVTINGQPIFEIVDTNSDIMKTFCQNHGNKFNLKQQRIINVDNRFSLVFD